MMRAVGEIEKRILDDSFGICVKLSHIIVVQDHRILAVIIKHCGDIMPDPIPDGIDPRFIADIRKEDRILTGDPSADKIPVVQV